jgi:hypothetical protein
MPSRIGVLVAMPYRSTRLGCPYGVLNDCSGCGGLRFVAQNGKRHVTPADQPPQSNDAKSGFACTVAKQRGYVFHHVREEMTLKLRAGERRYKFSVVARVRGGTAFARALLNEAATLFLSGDSETAHLVLRDLVVLNNWPR